MLGKKERGTLFKFSRLFCRNEIWLTLDFVYAV